MKRLNAHLTRRHRNYGERYAIRMVMRGGELHYSAVRPREDYVDCAETAVERLRAGHVVWVAQRSLLVTAVQRAIREDA